VTRAQADVSPSSAPVSLPAMNKEVLVEKLATLVESGGAGDQSLRQQLSRDLDALIATERRRFRTTSVVAMSEEDAVRYRAISELASDWVYAVRVDEKRNLKLEWATGPFEQITGYTVEDVNDLGGWVKLLHGRDSVYTLDSAVMRGEPSTLEYRIIARSGEEVWLRDYACPELDATGERVVRLFGAVKNVTEEVAAREALREAKQRLETRVGFDEARFRAVLDQAGEAIFMIDFDTGGFIDVNETACRILGYTRDELLAMRIDDIEADAPDWRSPARLNELKKGANAMERYHVRKDGTKFPVELVLSRRRYIGQEYILAVAREITERKEMEVQLAQADRLASVGVLAAGVAHEINNPLVYILNNVSYVLNDLPEQYTELRLALREARSGAERVRDIVKDLKTFARSDERMGPVDVTSLLESALKVAANEFKFRARVVRDYAQNLPLVEANSRLGQVFLNLVLNAAHAIREGDPDNNTISVSTRCENDRVLVSIRDTGSGIEADKLKKIFDPFFTTKPVGMGTGLGLSICRNITTSLGGEIQVQSELGAGSVFSVALPALERGHVVVAAPSTMPPPDVSRRSLNILVVDDDAFVARAIRRLLKPNHSVTIASGGAQALELMVHGNYDVVFCDVMMPMMTGMELHQEVKRRFPDLAHRFVFVTGGPFTPEARGSFDRVTNPCIQKPFTPAELANVLETHFLQHSSLEQLAAGLG
jgi:PAS domain S-box-containing protein